MPTLTTEVDLRAAGFTGFEPLRSTDAAAVPAGPGVYAVFRPVNVEPVFLTANPAGRFKRKDPTVPAQRLSREWVPGADVVYLGKAGSLAGRIGELLRFASGEPVAHWGGRLLWQVDLPYMLAWKETCDENPRLVEKGFLRDFSTHHGRLPFANLCH